MAQWFILDSQHADYASVLSALHTNTAAKYSGTVVQSIRSASHNSNIKLVKASITDAERTGSLAPLHRDNYGFGVFKDEYPDHAQKDLEAFSILGESDYINKHFEQPYAPNGSWVWSKKTLPDSSGDGRTYGDRIVGLKCANGSLGAIASPLTSKENWFIHGWFVDVWGISGGTIAGHALIHIYNGQDADNKFRWRFDHWLKPGAISTGHVLQHGVPWVKDGVTNAYSINETTGAHNSPDSQNAHKHYDPDFDTLEFTGELTLASSVANCKATAGTYIFDDTLDGGSGGWWVHMPDGSDPTGRVVGTGDFGFRFAWTTQNGAETAKQYVAFHGLKGRQFHIDFKPGSPIKVMEHMDFHMLNLKYTAGTEADSILFRGFVQGTGLNTAVRDILVNVDQVSRARNAFYFILQGGNVQSGRFERITVQADPAVQDGRENIFDIGGAVPSEADNDGHAVGIQTSNDFTIRNLKIRRTGGAIVPYAINFYAGSEGITLANRPFTNVLIEGNDIAEHSEYYPQKASTSASIGISFALDNVCHWDLSGAICRNNTVRGYDTIPSNAFLHCLRNQWHDQVIFEGNDCDLSASSILASNRNVSIKSITLSGASGNWNLNDRLEDNANPGVAIGIITKIEGANPTPKFYFIHPTQQFNVPADIADTVVVNNMDDTGSGTVNGGTASRGIGSNSLLRASALRRNRFGNSGGTVPWTSLTSGALAGGPDATDRLTGGVYLNESDTDFVGLASFAGLDIPGHAIDTLAIYRLFFDTGNSYGSGSVIVAP